MTSLADVRGGASVEVQGGRAEEQAERDLPLRAAGVERHSRSLRFSRDPRIVAGSIFMCCGWCTLMLLFVVLVSLLAHLQSVSLEQTLRMAASDTKLVTEADTRTCSRLRFDNPSQGLATMFVLSQAPEQLDRYSFSFNEPSRLFPQSPSSVYFAHLSPRANVTFNACKDDENADSGANAVRARLRLYAFNSYASYQDWLMHGRSSYVDSIEVVNLCSAGQPMTYRHSATSDNDWYYVFQLDDVSLTIVFKPGMSLERINYGVVADHLLDECITSGLLGTPNCFVRTVPGAHYLIRTEEDFDLAIATEMQATCTGVDEAYFPAAVASTIAISLIALVAFFGGVGLCICYCCKASLSNCTSSGCTLNCCHSSQLVSTTRRHDHGDYYDAQHLISQDHYGDTQEFEQGPPAAELTSEV